MSFINDDFMLSCDTAKQLYHEHAEKMPIIDYHCHLVPQQIAENIQFRDITQLWLVDGHYGDHYKWRAMRANGVSEDYLTGGRHSAWETFEKWAETVPYTMRNPLYHWTHLELKRVFGIDKLLSPKTAREIFEECNAKLARTGADTQVQCGDRLHHRRPRRRPALAQDDSRASLRDPRDPRMETRQGHGGRGSRILQ